MKAPSFFSAEETILKQDICTDTSMAPPTREEVYAIFQLLSNPPEGTSKFFDRHVSPDVQFTVPGHGRFAGHYASKESYMNGTWSKIRQALKAPGFSLCVTGGLNGMVVGDDGRVAVMLETRETYTVSGVKYEQFYSWHCRFDEEKRMVECRAYLDLGYLEDIVGTEMKRMGI